MGQIVLTEEQLEKLKTVIQEQETDWKSTALDVAGIFDPTGITDLYNAQRYYKQGNTLFAFLSLISAVPYVGDFIGKSVMGSMKAGGSGLKYLQAAETAAKAGNTKLAMKNLELLKKSEGPAGKMARTANEWGGKVDSFIDRIPNVGGVMAGFKNVMKNWVNLFRGVSSRTAGVQRLIKDKTPQEQVKLIQGLEGALKREKFLDPQLLSKPGFLSRIMYGGGVGLGRFSDLFGKSSLRTRVLMGQTKFYLSFLDYLGLGNFVGPEELSQMMGDEQMMAAMKNYEQSQGGQQALKDEFGNPLPTTQPNVSTVINAATSQISQSPFSSVLTKLMSPV